MPNLPVPENRESRHDQHCEKFFSSLREQFPINRGHIRQQRSSFGILLA
jgi:hypothetical protein